VRVILVEVAFLIRAHLLNAVGIWTLVKLTGLMSREMPGCRGVYAKGDKMIVSPYHSRIRNVDEFEDSVLYREHT